MALQSMADAPRGGGKHVILRTKWGQNWLAVFDGKSGGWRYGHAPLDLSDDDYFEGWLPYHGVEVWPYQSAGN